MPKPLLQSIDVSTAPYLFCVAGGPGRLFLGSSQPVEFLTPTPFDALMKNC